MSTITDLGLALPENALLEVLNEWIGKLRWFTANRKEPNLTLAGVQVLEKRAEDATILFVLASEAAKFFVPIIFLSPQAPELLELQEIPQAIIGSLKIQEQNYILVDATEHKRGQLVLLRACFGEFNLDVEPELLQGTALRSSTALLPEISSVQKIRSEQSNTSIIFHFATPDTAGSAGIILKLFRLLHIGLNPDVELQIALDRTGTRTVPRQYGWASLHTPEGSADFLVAQEFLAGAKDAWQVFQEELAAGTASPSQPETIIALGTMTADFHTALANNFPTLTVNRDIKLQALAKWQSQLAQAVSIAPALAPLTEAINSIFQNAVELEWPVAQRIHGDYHLGQILHSAEQGWFAFDFEGEPLKPLAERTNPSFALRDVAGILRSFDYAAGNAELTGQPTSFTRPWAESASALFLQGYGTLSDQETALLKAFMLDKALYEVIYEATYRPRWLSIPLRGVQALVSQHSE